MNGAEFVDTQDRDTIMTSSAQTFAARCRYLTLVGALGAFMSGAQAQTAPAAPATAAATTAATKKEEALLLNPFQVSTDRDVGYQAGNTLSGGRADTPLAITPASISVMTKEFMEDFNITDINQAAMWSLNMEAPTGQETGPFGGNQFQANFRGAGGSATYPSRNGFQQYVAADTYNSERFEFSRGPNNIIFGDAGAGGIEGSGSKQARYNSKTTTAVFRGDSYGGYRATVDTTYGVENVAFRVNILNQNLRPIVDGIRAKESAISLAGQVKLGKNTQLRAEFEKSAEKNRTYRKTYGDQVSLWDGTTVNSNNTVLPTATVNLAGLQQISATNDSLIFNASTGTLMNYNGAQYRTIGFGYAIPWRGRTDIPNFKNGIGKTFNISPVDDIYNRDINNRGVYLDHRFTPDLFLQLAWTSSDVDPVQPYFQSQPGEYRIDVNRLLPTGATNPNYLKPYADFGQNSQYQQNGLDEYRATASYRFQLPKLWDLKQRFVGMVGKRIDLYEAWNYELRRTDNPVVTDPRDGRNDVTFRVYWDQPRPALAPALQGLQQGVYNGMKFTNIDVGFEALNDVRLTYGQLASQTTFFDDRVALNLGIRRDKENDDKMGNVSTGTLAVPPYTVPIGNNNVPGLHIPLKTYRTSKSAGLVAYPFPASWKWIAPIGFVVNYSENFSVPPTGAPTLSGVAPEPPYAKTADWGLRYSMPNGVAYATLSHYNTTRLNNLAGGQSNSDISAIWTNLGYTDPALTNFPSYRDFNDNKLEGWESEVTVNPSRNVSFTVNYAHPITYTIRDSPDRRAYVAAHLAEWQAGAAAAPGATLNGKKILDPTIIAQSIQNIQNSFNGFAPGTLGNNLERHRINVAGRYRFTEGALKGFGFNLGWSYRGYKKNGSRDAIIKYNLNRAPTSAENAAASYDYLWVPPTYQMVAGANYTTRLWNHQLRFQLNIDNLLNNDKPLWTSYSTINAGQLSNQGNGNVNTLPGLNPRMQVLSGFNQLDPRKFTFTTTVTF
jgi:hypothetical protein